MARLRNSDDAESFDDSLTYGNAHTPIPEITPDGVGDGESGGVLDPGARMGETPRERPLPIIPGNQPGGEFGGASSFSPTSQLRSPDGSSGGGSQATPSRPSSPTPMSGTQSPQPGGGGVIPFEPMSPNVGAVGRPVGGGLFGSTGGLTGGGLGVPLDPVSNQQSNPLEMLLQILRHNGR